MEIEAPAADHAPPGAERTTAAVVRDAARVVYRYRELALVATLTAAAAFVRLWHLTTLPYGFHNDEGNTYLDAQQILRHGWIGPYSDRANGYPIAVNYWMALFVKAFDDPVLGIRLSIAILGIACIPLVYLVARNAAGWRVATCATVVLAFSLWHLHLSRVGFPVMGWPVAELGSLLCLQIGLRRQRWPWFVAAGLLIGLATWIYNSAFLYGAAVAIYLAVWFAVRNFGPLRASVVSFVRDRSWQVRPVRELLLLLILLAAALFAAAPLISYERAHTMQYQGHFKNVYIFDRPPHDNADIGEKLHVTGHNVLRFYRALTTDAYADGADGLGTTPPVGRITMYLALVGAAIALLRFRNPVLGIGLLVIPVLVISTAVTVDGQYRRSFGLIPFIAIFAGLTLGVIWEWADRQRLLLRGALLVVVVAPLVYVSYHNTAYYFRDYTHTPNARFVFFPEMREAAEYLDAHGHPYVYMYSERATLGHESRRVLAPNIAGGEERSTEFGPPPVRFDLAPANQKSFPITRAPDGVVFLFMGKYLPDAAQVAAAYPGGTLTEVDSAQYHVADFRAYYLPANLLDSYSRQEGVTFPVQTR